MELNIKFADATIAVKVSPLCTEASLGSCLAAHLEGGYDATLAPMSVADAGPLVDLLERGKYEPLSSTLRGVPRAEVECYRLFNDAMPMHVPGLLRDIEDALRKRVLHGLATVHDVRNMFAGYDRVQGVCDTLECLLPPNNAAAYPPLLLLTRADLERALDDEGCLFIFHGDFKVSIVFDMHYAEDGDDIPFYMYHWVCDIVEKGASTEVPMVFSVSNPSGKRYVSFEAMGPRGLAVVPSDKNMPLRELELLGRLLHGRRLAADVARRHGRARVPRDPHDRRGRWDEQQAGRVHHLCLCQERPVEVCRQRQQRRLRPSRSARTDGPLHRSALL